MNFTDHCTSLGIELLKEDYKYIRTMLERVPQNERKAIVGTYIEMWLMGIGSSINELEQQNLGRRRANNWLRKACTGI